MWDFLLKLICLTICWWMGWSEEINEKLTFVKKWLTETVGKNIAFTIYTAYSLIDIAKLCWFGYNLLIKVIWLFQRYLPVFWGGDIF